MIKRLIIILFSLLLCSQIFSEDKTYDSGRDPNKAALYSLMIPGGGQYYNDNYYKTAFWGSAEVGFIALTLYHNSLVNDYKDKRSNASSQDQWDKWNYEVGDQLEKRNNGLWWLGGTLILSIVDAYVDAALFNYDQEKERINLELNYNYIGLNYKF